MRVVRITRLDDPRVADFRDVPDAVLVRERGLFVAEGRLVVQRLLAAERFHTRALLVTDTALVGLTPYLETDRVRDVPIYLRTADLLRRIGGFNFHRGCLAIGDRPAPIRASTLLSRAAPHRPLVVIERVGDADNVGSIFRNAAAFGAAAVVLSAGYCDPLYRKAIRTSMGACLQVPFTTLDEWPDELGAARRLGYYLVALTPDRGATCLTRFAVPVGVRGVALLLGSEGEGLSPAVVAMADVGLRIGIEANVDSLNVATAAAVALHYLSRLYSSRDTAR